VTELPSVLAFSPLNLAYLTHATLNTQHTTHNTQHTTHNTQHTTPQTRPTNTHTTQSATAALLHLPNSPVPKHSKSLFPSSDKENASQLRNTTALSAPSLPSVVSKTVPSMASLTSPAPTASRCTSHNGVGAMTPSQLDLITFSPMNFVKNLGIENVAGTSVNGGVNGNYGHPGNSANGDNSNNPMMPPPPVVGEGYLKQRSRTMSTSHANGEYVRILDCPVFCSFPFVPLTNPPIFFIPSTYNIQHDTT